MIRQTALLLCFLAPVASHAATLRSPWDADPVALTAAPYTCPVVPPVPHDLTTDGFYRPDDPPTPSSTPSAWPPTPPQPAR